MKYLDSTNISNILAFESQASTIESLDIISKGGDNYMFTYVASATSRGNENIKRICSHCSQVFYVSYGAQNYRCPHCNWQCG